MQVVFFLKTYVLHKGSVAQYCLTGFKPYSELSKREPNDLTHDASHRITNDFTYFDNASHSASQRLLVTRAIALLPILHILKTRAIPRANAYL